MRRTLSLSPVTPPVCRLGLATRGNTHLDPDDVHWVVERGVNYLNWCGRPDGMSKAVSEMGSTRDRVVIAWQIQSSSEDGARRELDIGTYGSPTVTSGLAVSAGAPAGTYSFTIRYTFDDIFGFYVGLESILYTVTVQPVPIDILPISLNFGTLNVGEAVGASFLVKNIIGRQLTFAVTAPGGVIIQDPGDIFFSLGFGQIKTIDLTFFPGNAGQLNGQVFVSRKE